MRGDEFLGGKDGDYDYLDEVEYSCRDGSIVWCEVTTRFTRNERDEMILLGIMRNITERKKAEEQIRNLAFYDTLTQLPNRRLLQDRFSQTISACKRNNRYAAVMFIDLAISSRSTINMVTISVIFCWWRWRAAF